MGARIGTTYRNESEIRMLNPWPRTRHLCAPTVAGVLLAGSLAAVPVGAAASPNSVAPMMTAHACGDHVTVTKTTPHAGFNPLTATDAELLANDLPTRPTNAKDLATWKHYVTSRHAAPTCPIGDGHRGHPVGEQSAASVGSETTANWAGFEATAGHHLYRDVYTHFHVPQAAYHSSNTYMSTWDGIGQGSGSKAHQKKYPISQGGSESDEWAGDTAHYFLWWELFPWNNQKIIATNVHYGDLIFVRSHFSHNNAWVNVVDETTGAGGGRYKYSSATNIYPDHTAEWITERTDIGGYFPKLSKGNTKFTGASAKGSIPTTVLNKLPRTKITMKNCTSGPDKELAHPSDLQSHGAFTVYWHHYGTVVKDSCHPWP